MNSRKSLSTVPTPHKTTNTVNIHIKAGKLRPLDAIKFKKLKEHLEVYGWDGRKDQKPLKDKSFVGINLCQMAENDLRMHFFRFKKSEEFEVVGVVVAKAENDKKNRDKIDASFDRMKDMIRAREQSGEIQE